MAVYITIPWLSSSPHPKKKTNKQIKIKKKKKKKERDRKAYLCGLMYRLFCKSDGGSAVPQ